MADVQFIKVKIGLKPNGHAKYPDWEALPLAAAGSTREDRQALVRAAQPVKWQYDKRSGHTDDTADSPERG